MVFKGKVENCVQQTLTYALTKRNCEHEKQTSETASWEKSNPTMWTETGTEKFFREGHWCSLPLCAAHKPSFFNYQTPQMVRCTAGLLTALQNETKANQAIILPHYINCRTYPSFRNLKSGKIAS